MGKVDDDDASVFRIAASLAAWNNYAETDDDQVEGDYAEWDSTDKHRVLFVIKKTKLKELGHESAQARPEVWRHLRLVLSELPTLAGGWKWHQKYIYML